MFVFNKMKAFESTVLFQEYLKVRDISNSQSSTKVLYHQTSFQLLMMTKKTQISLIMTKRKSVSFLARLQEAALLLITL